GARGDGGLPDGLLPRRARRGGVLAAASRPLTHRGLDLAPSAGRRARDSTSNAAALPRVSSLSACSIEGRARRNVGPCDESAPVRRPRTLTAANPATLVTDPA